MIIKVTASVEYIYDTADTENFGIATPEDAIDDVWSMIANGEVSAGDFDYSWEVEPKHPGEGWE